MKGLQHDDNDDQDSDYNANCVSDDDKSLDIKVFGDLPFSSNSVKKSNRNNNNNYSRVYSVIRRKNQEDKF